MKVKFVPAFCYTYPDFVKYDHPKLEFTQPVRGQIFDSR